MKKYKVVLGCCDIVRVEVEAENKEQAIEIARNEARGEVCGDEFVLHEIEVLKS